MSEQQYTDEFFINLTMDYDHRDDTIYPKWAVWCAKSDDRYYIDGKDHHFYTHRRTDEEVMLEKKKRAIMDFCMHERMKLDPMDFDSEEFKKFQKYEDYINDNLFDESKIKDFNPMTYAQWSSEQDK